MGTRKAPKVHWSELIKWGIGVAVSAIVRFLAEMWLHR